MALTTRDSNSDLPRRRPGKFAAPSPTNGSSEATLWQHVWEAKSEKKELERFIVAAEARLGLTSQDGKGPAGKGLVERMKQILSVSAAVSVEDAGPASERRGDSSPADEALREIQHMFMSHYGQTPVKRNKKGGKGSQYRPKKHSLTTFAFANTPTHSGTLVLTARPAWQPDSAATECPSCRSAFSMWNRRHHCRACGGLFDDKCCDNMVRIFSLRYDEPVRVCKFCLPVVVRDNTERQSKSIHGPYECSVPGNNHRHRACRPDGDQERGGESKVESGELQWHLDKDLQWCRGRRKQAAPVAKRRLLQQSLDPAAHDEGEQRLRADLLRQHLVGTRVVEEQRRRHHHQEYQQQPALDMRGYRRVTSAAVDLVCDRF